MNEMEQQIANNLLYWHGVVKNEPRQGTMERWLVRATQILSTETEDYRIAMIKKGEPPLLSNTDLAKAVTEYRTILELNGHRPTPADSKHAIAEAQRSSDIEYYRGE